MDEVILFLSLVLLAVVLSVAGILAGYSSGYRRGQIDYSNGIKKYCLTIQTDSSKIWELCDAK